MSEYCLKPSGGGTYGREGLGYGDNFRPVNWDEVMNGVPYHWERMASNLPEIIFFYGDEATEKLVKERLPFSWYILVMPAENGRCNW